jgi:hypothetical protein
MADSKDSNDSAPVKGSGGSSSSSSSSSSNDVDERTAIEQQIATRLSYRALAIPLLPPMGKMITRHGELMLRLFRFAPVNELKAVDAELAELGTGDKCSVCREFYRHGGPYCSYCKIKETVPNYQAMYSFTPTDIRELFERYKSAHNLRNIRLGDTKFKALLNLTKDMTPTELYPFLLGLRDHPPVALTAAQGEALLANMTKKTADNSWRYSHAIFSLVIDWWSITDGIGSCYYAPPYTCGHNPARNSKIIAQWDDNGCFGPSKYGVSFLDSFVLEECSVCLEKVVVKGGADWGRCEKCKHYFHLECVEGKVKECPLCRSAW